MGAGHREKTVILDQHTQPNMSLIKIKLALNRKLNVQLTGSGAEVLCSVDKDAIR